MAASGWTWHPTNESAYIYFTNTFELSEAWVERYALVTGTNPAYAVTTNDAYPYLEFFTNVVNDSWLATNYCDPRSMTGGTYNGYFLANPSEDNPPVWTATGWVSWATGGSGWEQTNGMAAGEFSPFPYWEMLAQVYTGVCGLGMTWGHGAITQIIDRTRTVFAGVDDVTDDVGIDVQTIIDETFSNDCDGGSAALATNTDVNAVGGVFDGDPAVSDWDTGDIPTDVCDDGWGAWGSSNTYTSGDMVTGSITAVCSIDWWEFKGWWEMTHTVWCTNDGTLQYTNFTFSGEPDGDWEWNKDGNFWLAYEVNGTEEQGYATYTNGPLSTSIAADVYEYNKVQFGGSSGGHTQDYVNILTNMTLTSDINEGTHTVGVGDSFDDFYYVMQTQTVSVAYEPDGSGCELELGATNVWFFDSQFSKPAASNTITWVAANDHSSGCALESAYSGAWSGTNTLDVSLSGMQAATAWSNRNTHVHTQIFASGLDVYVGGGQEVLVDGKLVVYDWDFAYQDDSVF